MKKAFAGIVLLLMLSSGQGAQAQALALETCGAAQQCTTYTPASFSYHASARQMATNTKVGIIMSGVGIVTGVVGVGILISNFDVANSGENTLGVILFVAGGVIGITGGCLSIGGMMQQRHKRYSFNIVTPKNNQLGVAYNF